MIYNGPPDAHDIEAAWNRIGDSIVTTPLLESDLLNAEVGGRVLVKAEVLQRTGSFKFRGACNRLKRLSAAERARGVVAYSSGNHAQGIAAAAQEVGTTAIIVMPVAAPAIKVARCTALGAEVILHDGDRDSMVVRATDLANAQGRVLVPPFDDTDIIAGQGTVGLEIAYQAKQMKVTPDAVIVPCSGGGLSAGIALALEDRLPGTALYTAEPVGFDDMARSLRDGERLSNTPGHTTLCDALMVPRPGALTFPVLRRLARGGFTVSDDDVLRAMANAFIHFKLVVEPGGAAALATLFNGQWNPRGRTTIVVASGGNADPATFATALTRFA